MKQNKLTIIFFSLLVALAFMACNDDLLEKHPWTRSLLPIFSSNRLIWRFM